MKANRRRDTSTEWRVRSAIHGMGLRYRVDLPIRVAGARPIRPDLVFTAARVAVFVDGCFWHGCPIHGTTPTTRSEYWISKIQANRARDARQADALTAAGWKVVRAWEHEDPADVAARVAALVRSSRSDRGSR